MQLILSATVSRETAAEVPQSQLQSQYKLQVPQFQSPSVLQQGGDCANPQGSRNYMRKESYHQQQGGFNPTPSSLMPPRQLARCRL